MVQSVYNLINCVCCWENSFIYNEYNEYNYGQVYSS